MIVGYWWCFTCHKHVNYIQNLIHDMIKHHTIGYVEFTRKKVVK